MSDEPHTEASTVLAKGLAWCAVGALIFLEVVGAATLMMAALR